MNQLWQILDGTSPTISFTPDAVLISLLLAFVLGQLMAWVYYLTHSGMSYSKSFVQSLILLTVIVSLVMSVIGNSIITAFGLMGALALVRFRNVVKDTRDIAFIFSAVVIGMAAGSQHFTIALVGTVLICLIAVYLTVTAFGAHQPHNGFLRFELLTPMIPGHPVLKMLKKYCSSFVLVSLQDTGTTSEYAYHITVRQHENNEQMLAELEQVEGISNINLTMREELLEV